MKLRKILFALSIFLALPLLVEAYTGAGSILALRKGDFIPTPFAGDTTGFGKARDFCLLRGGGVIQLGPGLENLVLTYPAGANLLILRSFITGWSVDPPMATGTSGSGIIEGVKSGSLIKQPFSGDLTGLRSAINYVGPGGNVKLYPGFYTFNGTVNIYNPGITIEGSGDSTTIHLIASDTLFVVSADNVTLKNFSIDGHKSVLASGEGITVTANNFTADNLTIRDTYGKSIHVHTGSNNATIQNCKIYDTGGSSATDGYGIVLHNTTNSKVVNNIIKRTKNHSIWTQLASSNITIANNTIEDSKADAIMCDSTGRYINIVGNHISRPLSSGITADADSMLVADNIIEGAWDFGIWSQYGGNGSSWWGNAISQSNNYGMALKPPINRNISGFSVFSNTVFGTKGIPFDFQVSTNGSLSNVQVSNNYFIEGGSLNPTFPMLRFIGTTGGQFNRIHILGNVIKNGIQDGLRASGSITRYQDFVITNNQFISNGTTDTTAFAIQLDPVKDSSNVILSSNLYHKNGKNPNIWPATIDQDSVSVIGWSRGFPSPKRGDNGIGSVSPLGSLQLYGNQVMSSGDIVVGGNIAFFNPDSVGIKNLLYGIPPGAGQVGSGNLQFRTGNYYSQGMVFRDTVGTAGGGAGTQHKVMYMDQSGNLRVQVPRVNSVFKNILFSSEADSLSFLSIITSGGGTGNLDLTGTLISDGASFDGSVTQSGNRLLVVDSLRVGLTSRKSPAIITGPITGYSTVLFNSGLWVRDSIVTDSIRAKRVLTDTLRANAMIDVASGNVIVKNGNAYQLRDVGGTPRGFASSSGTDNLNLYPLSGSGRVNIRNFGGSIDALSANSTGDIWIGSSGVIGDSLVVAGTTKLGLKAIAGNAGTAESDSLFVLLNGTNFGAARSPKIEFQRNGTPFGALQAYGGGMELRVATGQDISFGNLGVTGARTKWQDGFLAINKTNDPSFPLEVVGETRSDSVSTTGNINPGNHIIMAAAKHVTLTNSGKLEVKDTGGTARPVIHTAGGTNTLRISPISSGGSIDILSFVGAANITFTDDGIVIFKSFTQATLPTVLNGGAVYCSDCNKASTPCTGGGTGAMAFGINGQWDCGP